MHSNPGFVIFVTYCALLTAAKSSSSSLPDLSDFSKLLKLDYQLLIFPDSITEQVLKFSVPGSSAYQLYVETIKDNPYAYISSMDDVKEKMLSNPKAVFLGFESNFQSDNRFLVLSGFKESMEYSGSFVLPKNSEFTGLFGYHLNHILEVGLEELAERTWLKQKEIGDSVDPSQSLALGFESIGFPFVCLAVSIWIAAIMAVLEWAGKMKRN